jgi:hypothetical protein
VVFCCAAYNQRGDRGGVSGSIGGGGGSGHGGGTDAKRSVKGGVKRQRGTGSPLAVGRGRKLRAAAAGGGSAVTCDDEMHGGQGRGKCDADLKVKL